jgi:hypothetical protein
MGNTRKPLLSGIWKDAHPRMETCHTGINAGMACVMDTHRCLVTVADTELTLRPEADLANGPPHPTGNCHPKEDRDWSVDFLIILKEEAGVGVLPQQGFAGPQLRRIFSNWPTVRARLEPLRNKMRHCEHPPAEGPTRAQRTRSSWAASQVR